MVFWIHLLWNDEGNVTSIQKIEDSLETVRRESTVVAIIVVVRNRFRDRTIIVEYQIETNQWRKHGF